MTVELELAVALATIMDELSSAQYSLSLPENLQPFSGRAPSLFPDTLMFVPEPVDVDQIRLIPVDYKGSPGMTTHDDVDGDGYEDDPIPVIGERENDFSEPSPPGASDGGGGGEPTGVDPPPEAILDCRDRAALAAKSDILAHTDDGRKEHGSIIWRDSSGQVQRSAVFHGPQGVILQSDVESAMTRDSIRMDQVIALVHNHDRFHYGTTSDGRALNRYPSGGILEGGDWNAADWMVANGAGGSSGSNFALYIIDTSGQLREFHYTDRDKYANMSRDDRISGVDLPDEMESDGTTCG